MISSLPDFVLTFNGACLDYLLLHDEWRLIGAWSAVGYQRWVFGEEAELALMIKKIRVLLISHYLTWSLIVHIHTILSVTSSITYVTHLLYFRKEEAVNNNIIVFGLIRLGLGSTIYNTWEEHDNHYTTATVKFLQDIY
jgi:hypothetical protein